MTAASSPGRSPPSSKLISPSSTRCWRITSAGRLDEDEFRIFRLNNGIYGQRQGGHHQMVRVKAPYGSISPGTARRCWPTSLTATAGAGAT